MTNNCIFLMIIASIKLDSIYCLVYICNLYNLSLGIQRWDLVIKRDVL